MITGREDNEELPGGGERGEELKWDGYALPTVRRKEGGH